MLLLTLTILIITTNARYYPLYKQCDPTWKNDHIGTSSTNICTSGSLISSVAMALAGTGTSFNPQTLNIWLKQHEGYIRGQDFVWSSINSLGLTYQGKISKTEIKKKLDQQKVVICNVRSGTHWVLAYGYSADNIIVHDPGYIATSYPMTQIMESQTGVYKVGNVQRLRVFKEEMIKLGKMVIDGDGVLFGQKYIRAE